MKKEGFKSEIIKFVESSTDEENLMLAVFIAGMKSQKGINPTPSIMDKKMLLNILHYNF